MPALLGLVIAVLGTGAAIAISGDGEEESAIPTATGGSLTVTGGTPTLTAPEPTTPTETTAPATTAPTTTTAAARESGGDHVASRPARLDDRPPLPAADERAGRRGGPGEEGA